MRFLEDRQRLVVLSELLVRETEMRQQHRKLVGIACGARSEIGDDRRQRLDHRLILMPLLERLGQRVIAPRALGILCDDAARGGFRRTGIAAPPLGLREQVQRARIVRTRRQDVLEHRAGLGDVVSAAGVQQRRRIARPQVGAARPKLHRVRVRVRRLFPPPLALVEVGERRVELRRIGGRLLEPSDRVRVAAGA